MTAIQKLLTMFPIKPTLGKYKFLFMADVGIKGYEMIDKYMEDIDVLKVAHHGAKNTVSHYMLNKIKPEYAIISTGKNPYGHPNKFTVMELKKKSKVLSTREYGAIKFVVDENLTPYSYNRKTNRFMEVKF